MPVGISDVKSHFFNSAGTESADTKVEVFSNGMPFWLRRIMASSYGVSAAGESIFEVWDWDPVAGYLRLLFMGFWRNLLAGSLRRPSFSITGYSGRRIYSSEYRSA